MAFQPGSFFQPPPQLLEKRRLRERVAWLRKYLPSIPRTVPGPETERVWSRAKRDTERVQKTWFTRVVVLLVDVAAVITVEEILVSENKASVTVGLLTAAAFFGATFAIIGMIYVFELARTPFRQRKEWRAQIGREREEAKGRWQAERDAFEAKWAEAEDLRGQLGHAENELRELRPKFEETRSELERLTRPHASRLAIKNLAQAAVSSLADRTREFEDPANALAWLTATAEWLGASVGEGEARRFMDLAGGTELVKGYKFGQDATLLWPLFNGTRAREWLEELIARADRVTVVQTFNPDEWKDTYA